MSNQPNEIQSYASLLREIADLCDHASLTDSLRGGSGRVVIRYNSTLNRLVELEAVPKDFFSPLPENANYGEIGVESRMLHSYINGKRKNKGGGDASVLMRLAPFVDSKDLGMMIREQVKQGLDVSMDTLTQLAPFLDQETLGSLIRQNMQAVAPEEKATTEEKAEAEVPPAPSAPPAPEVKPTLDELLERLKYPYLSAEQRDDLLNQIRNLES